MDGDSGVDESIGGHGDGDGAFDRFVGGCGDGAVDGSFDGCGDSAVNVFFVGCRDGDVNERVGEYMCGDSVDVGGGICGNVGATSSLMNLAVAKGAEGVTTDELSNESISDESVHQGRTYKCNMSRSRALEVDSACSISADLPTYTQMNNPFFNWGDMNGKVFCSSIESAYSEVIHWRRNSSKCPQERQGKTLFWSYQNYLELTLTTQQWKA